MQLHACIIKKSRGGARGECRVGGGGLRSREIVAFIRQNLSCVDMDRIIELNLYLNT